MSAKDFDTVFELVWSECNSDKVSKISYSSVSRSRSEYRVTVDTSDAEVLDAVKKILQQQFSAVYSLTDTIFIIRA